MLTVLSPALMIWLLAGKSGKPLTEKAMSARPGYKEYVESTSGFLPAAAPPSPQRRAGPEQTGGQQTGRHQPGGH